MSIAVKFQILQEYLGKILPARAELCFNLNGNNINISHINILQPTTLENFALSPLSGNLDEASKTALAQAIQYTGDDLIYSPIFKYSAEYDPKSAMFNFTRLASGARPQYDALNPGIMASSVASQLGGYLIQLNSYDEAFKTWTCIC